MTELFHYHCGTPVQVGDRVRYSEWECIIGKVFAPDTGDAGDFHCSEEGGVMLSLIQGGEFVPFILLTPPDREQWEDLEFVARATQP
jgi:hypothetical protein